MTVRELLEKIQGVDSYGLYDDPNGDIPQASISDLMKNADKLINYFDVWIYDDTDFTNNGEKIKVKKIRCCIYLK